MRQIYRVANTIHEAQRAHMNLSKIEIDDSVLFLPIFVCSHDLDEELVLISS